MYELIDELYNIINNMLNANPYELPIKINSLIYDNIFTGISGTGYYNKIFTELHEYVNNGVIKYLCSSSDVGDEVECGDYDYYCGFTTGNIAILYMYPSHRWAFPDKLIIYGNAIQIEVCSDIASILVYELNAKIREAISNSNNTRVFDDIIDILRNTDRDELFKERWE